ncbi:hypothetical protein, partial [Pseudomonas sp. PS01302]|uniref:hypothetical protein n=1 Tax=Pseudomonas sp. PS01302 TaxID=2991438 RepID=UPI00249AC070
AMRRVQSKGTYAITDEQIAAQEQIEKDQDNGIGDDGKDLPGFNLGETDGDKPGDAGAAEKETPRP